MFQDPLDFIRSDGPSPSSRLRLSQLSGAPSSSRSMFRFTSMLDRYDDTELPLRSTPRSGSRIPLQYRSSSASSPRQRSTHDDEEASVPRQRGAYRPLSDDEEPVTAARPLNMPMTDTGSRSARGTNLNKIRLTPISQEQHQLPRDRSSMDVHDEKEEEFVDDRHMSHYLRSAGPKTDGLAETLKPAAQFSSYDHHLSSYRSPERRPQRLFDPNAAPSPLPLRPEVLIVEEIDKNTSPLSMEDVAPPSFTSAASFERPSEVSAFPSDPTVPHDKTQWNKKEQQRQGNPSVPRAQTVNVEGGVDVATPATTAKKQGTAAAAETAIPSLSSRTMPSHATTTQQAAVPPPQQSHTPPPPPKRSRAASPSPSTATTAGFNAWPSVEEEFAADLFGPRASARFTTTNRTHHQPFSASSPARTPQPTKQRQQESSASPSSTRTPARPATSTTVRHSGAPSATAKEIAAHYFSILREAQSSPERSPDHTTDKKTKNSAATESKPQAKASASVSKHHHLLARSFELVTDGSSGAFILRVPSTPGGTEPPSTTSEEEQKASSMALQKFSCAAEVSSLVNVGDAALFHIIDQRAKFDQKSLPEMCRATSALMTTIAAQLKRMDTVNASSQDKNDDAESQRENHTVAEDDLLTSANAEQREEARRNELLSLVNQLRHMFEPSVAVPQQQPLQEELMNDDEEEKDDEVRNRTKEATTTAGDALTELLAAGTANPLLTPMAIHMVRALLQAFERTQQQQQQQPQPQQRSATGDGEQQQQQQGQQLPEADDVFDLGSFLAEVETLARSEEGAKEAGNLIHSASTRRELLKTLHRGLHAVADVVDRADHKDNAEPAEIAQEVRSFLRQMHRSSTDSLAQEERSLRADQQILAKLEDTLSVLRSEHEQLVEEQDQFLTDNASEMQDTIRKIDELYHHLEALVHARNARIKDSVVAFGNNISQQAEAQQALRNHQRTSRWSAPDASSFLDRGDVTGGAAHPRIRALHEQLALIQSMELTFPAMQAAILSKRKHDEQRRQVQREDLLHSAETIGVQLRTSLSQWMDVLLRNNNREADRAASLQQQIREATQRYHQEDVDLFRGQLDECLARKQRIEVEIVEWDKQFREDEKIMHRLVPQQPAAAHNHSSASMNTSHWYPTQQSASRPSTRGAAAGGMMPQFVGDMSTDAMMMFQTPIKQQQQHFYSAAASPAPFTAGRGRLSGAAAETGGHFHHNNHPLSTGSAHEEQQMHLQQQLRSPATPSTCLVVVDATPARQAAQRSSTSTQQQQQQSSAGGLNSAGPTPIRPTSSSTSSLLHHPVDLNVSATPLPTNVAVIAEEEVDDDDELADLDSLTVAEFVPLFRKAPPTTEKWIRVLWDYDIETLRDVRDLKETAVWQTFLAQHPLLKGQLELILEKPMHFVEMQQ